MDDEFNALFERVAAVVKREAFVVLENGDTLTTAHARGSRYAASEIISMVAPVIRRRVIKEEAQAIEAERRAARSWLRRFLAAVRAIRSDLYAGLAFAVFLMPVWYYWWVCTS